MTTTAGFYVQVDQNLARAWLWCVQLHDFGGERARLVVDDGLVLLGDLWGSHCVLELDATLGIGLMRAERR